MMGYFSLVPAYKKELEITYKEHDDPLVAHHFNCKSIYDWRNFLQEDEIQRLNDYEDELYQAKMKEWKAPR